MPLLFDTEDGLAIRASFKHLMSCLNSVFGWGEASTSANRALLQEAFENIAVKIAAGTSTAASTQRAASEALEVIVCGVYSLKEIFFVFTIIFCTREWKYLVPISRAPSGILPITPRAFLPLSAPWSWSKYLSISPTLHRGKVSRSALKKRSRLCAKLSLREVSSICSSLDQGCIFRKLPHSKIRKIWVPHHFNH